MKKLMSLILFFSSSIAFTQDLTIFQKKEFPFVDGKSLPYRILYPDNYDKNKKYPLVLFLHGSGERGNDNEKQLMHGARLFVAEETRKNYPAIVIFPQCPVSSFWAIRRNDVSKIPNKYIYDYTMEADWSLVAANELVKKLVKEEAVDKSRIYITGLSMGGMGTFESVFRYSKMYAAALPICGAGDLVNYDKRVKKTVFWVFHGDADPDLNVNYSRQMVAKLKLLKIKVKYTEYPGVKHNSWNNAFADSTYISWMFSQKRRKVKI